MSDNDFLFMRRAIELSLENVKKVEVLSVQSLPEKVKSSQKAAAQKLETFESQRLCNLFFLRTLSNVPRSYLLGQNSQSCFCQYHIRCQKYRL